MTEGRWYPTVINLPTNELLLMEGYSNTTTTLNYIPDVWNPSTNSLRRLTNASTQTRNVQHLYPWLHVAPNGKVFYAGSTTSMAYLTTSGTGSWGSTTNRDGQARFYGSSVMYRPSRLLIVGGGGNNNKTAVTVNLSGGGAQVAATGSMTHGRTHLNATVLPNGHIFVNGGNTSGTNFDDTTSVYPGEIWNPSTGLWSLTASAAKPRNYHAVALLLPDGRVWTAGGGGCGTCSVNQQNAQIFYPPYLFKKDGSGLLASRPRIRSAPNTIGYGQSLTIESQEAASVRRVSLISLGSVTHAFNMNQRYVPLTINSQGSSSLSVTTPANKNVAPPGYYMLFLVDNQGVPSLGRIVKIQ